MATYNRHIKGKPVRRKKQKYSLLERVIDFSQKPIIAGQTIDLAWASGDVLEIIGIRAGQTVLHVEAEVLKKDAQTTPATIQIGDGDNASRWGSVDVSNGKRLTKKAEAADQTGIDFYSAIKHYSSADTIDLTIYDVLTTARVKVIVHLLEDDR